MDEAVAHALELVAHRAGNDAAHIAPAAAVADTVELDVHTFRGRLEIRHSKVIWPWRVYWERGVGIVRDEHPAALADIVAATPRETAMWADLKGFSGRFTRRVLQGFDDRPPDTVSSRSWWILGPARRAGVTTYRSVGSRWQLALALVLRHPDGIVIHERFVTRPRFDRLVGRCAGIAVWAVHDHERAVELRRLGVRALILDDLGLIASLRG